MNRLKSKAAHAVCRVPIGPVGQCYWNVQDQIDQHGGAMAQGWQLLEWPGLYLMAMHHAVWQSPAGQLLDITRDGDLDSGGVTLFAPNISVQIDLAWPPYIDNHYVVTGHPVVAKLVIDAEQGQLADNRRLAADMRRIGIPFNPRTRFGIPQNSSIDLPIVLKRKALHESLVGAAWRATQGLPGVAPLIGTT